MTNGKANFDIASVRNAPRVCFFAHYHVNDVLAEHVVFYLDALRRYGFQIVVLSTSNVSAADEDRLNAMDIQLIRRSNEGLDFGGWIEACLRFFPLQAELLMLANDSVYAPIGDLTTFLDQLLGVQADVYGAIESLEIAPHLQSWMLLFRPEAYRSAAFRDVMCNPMPVMRSKLELIQRYEIGLTERLRDAGLRLHAAYRMTQRPGLAGRFAYNPTHVVWRELIEDGLPFLKIDLMRTNPMRLMDLHDWRSVVEKRQPALLPMIEDDLRRRPPISGPSYVAQSKWRPIYWPEVRGLVRADFRKSRYPGARHPRRFLAGFYAITALVAAPRLAWRFWTRIRR